MQYTTVSQFTNMISVYKGAISTVFRAKCLETGRKLIVKIYFREKMNSKQVHKLERELELQKLVKNCPYVCNLVDNFDEGNKTHIILEDCEGGDLFKKMMKQGGSIAESRACTEVIVPLLRVLETLDKLNIIHRDIKPENIFLTGSGQIRLGDFGLAIDCSKEIPFYRSGEAELCTSIFFGVMRSSAFPRPYHASSKRLLTIVLGYFCRHPRLYGPRSSHQPLHKARGG